MTVSPRPTRLFARCCLALALGILVGPYATGHRQTMGVAVAVATILAIAVAGGALADGAIRRKLLGVLLAEIALCALGTGVALLVVWLVGWSRGAPDLIVTLAIALAPVAAGFAFAHTAGKDGAFFKTATLVGMLTWLGILGHFVSYGLFQFNEHSTPAASPTNATSGHLGPGGLDMVGFVLTGILLFFTVGFIYAAGAGLLGAGCRRALTRLTGGR